MTVEKTVVISTEHPKNRTEKTQTINLEMHGGDPWFGHIWINDELHVIRQRPRSFELQKVR